MLLAYVGFSNAYVTELGPWLALITWLGAYWLVIVVHELGHAGAAILCGWKIVVIAVGPIGYQIHNREYALIPRAKREERAGLFSPFPEIPRSGLGGEKAGSPPGGH